MKISSINSPLDLKQLSDKELIALSQNIRRRIINLAKKKKIHLSSNLGIVELTISLLKHFPHLEEQIFFDTGHQCYVHKILTGRNAEFDTIRDFNGLSGFQANHESPYDFFATGHSSNSLSIAQGYLESTNAKKLVVVIGDAAISNGLAFEALNNIGFNQNKMLIILNDNGMSISRNVGQLSLIFNEMNYENYFYDLIKNCNDKKVILRFIQLEKKLNPSNFFHQLGFYYIGKIDGHNFQAIEQALLKGKFYAKYLPTIIHLQTIKGKGLENQDHQTPQFHTSNPLDEKVLKKTFSKLASEKLFKLIQADKNIKIINAAMTYGLDLEKIEKSFKDNFEDVGINEEHCIAKAAGISIAKKKVVVNMYASFLQRTYDQILHDVCREKLPILFLIDRADLSFGDGDTHHGIYDLGMIKSIPNNVITMPSTDNQLKQLINFGLNSDLPFFIRINNEVPLKKDQKQVIYGDWIYLKHNQSHTTCIISYGNVINKIAKAFHQEPIDLLNAIFLKGYDEKLIIKKLKKYNKIIFYERVYFEGAIYKDIVALINKYDLKIKCYLIAFKDSAIGFGDEKSLNDKNQMEIEQIKKFI
ncbi:MAG: 1-deoxy-D-xylulose-5-phosphate synthase [Mycoplasmoidaceae bacterium]